MKTKPDTQQVVSHRNWRRKDRCGQRYGRLVVGAYAGSRRSQSNGRMVVMWECTCDCGEVTYVSSTSLTGGVQSCGCLLREAITIGKTRHGYCGTKEYRAFLQARNRCESDTCPKYKDYGGRGIEFRFAEFSTFLAELGPAPSPRHSVDRINTNGHYEAGNVRWATPKMQSLNRRNARLVAFEGKSHRLKEWAAITGVPHKTLRRRIDELGWTVEKALTTPLMKKALEISPQGSSGNR